MTDPGISMNYILFEIVPLEIETFRLRERGHQQVARRSVKFHDTYFFKVLANSIKAIIAPSQRVEVNILPINLSGLEKIGIFRKKISSGGSKIEIPPHPKGGGVEPHLGVGRENVL